MTKPQQLGRGGEEMNERQNTTTYIPTFAAAWWDVVGDFVRTAVADAGGMTAYSDADLLQAVSRHVLWCWQSAGCELDLSVIFARQMIGYAVPHAFPELTGPSQGNRRSKLLRVSEALRVPQNLHTPLPALPAASPHAPYTARELTVMRNWVEYQPTRSMRRSAAAVLALGTGTGLTARELAGVCREDVTVDRHGMQVFVRDSRERHVSLLLDSAVGSKPLFRSEHTVFFPNIVTNFVARSAGTELKPQTQRLRATWMVTHLSAGTPALELMGAAGVTSLEALTRYLRFAVPREPSEVRALFRDAS